MDDLSTIFFDILVLIAILISILLAFYRGLFKELLSTFLWIGSITLGLLGSLELTLELSSHLPGVPGLNWIIGGVISIISFLLGSFANRWLIKRLNIEPPTVIDRSLGFLFGFIRGIFLVSCAFIVLHSLIGKELIPIWVKSSKLTFLLQNSANVIIYLIPKNLDKQLKDFGIPSPQNTPPPNFEKLNSPQKVIKPKDLTPGYTTKQRNRMEDVIRNLN
jgi:membrane protein required for colicin V production